MRIERISGAILILLSGVLLLMAAYGGTPEDRDATAILLTLPMGLVALFTEIPERGKRTKRDYRETGKESMKMLTQGEVNTVARVLQNMKDSVSRSVRDKRTDTGGDIRTTAQRRKIYALCEALGWNDDPRRIQGFVKRVAHVDRIEWLNIAQCEKVIEGLKAILARQRRKEAEL